MLSLGEIIRNRRNELKLSQLQLAELAGISVNTVFKVENGQISPTIEMLGKITEVIGMEIRVEIKDLNRNI